MPNLFSFVNYSRWIGSELPNSRTSGWSWLHGLFCCCLFDCFVCFYRPTPTAYGGRFPSKGLNWSYSCLPTPQAQQHGIRATSAAYTTAQGNAESLTHCTRLGNEPLSSWILVRFVFTELQQELPWTSFSILICTFCFHSIHH